MAAHSISRIMVLNRYYKMTRFYDFLKSMSIKTGITLAIFMIAFAAFDYFIIDIKVLLNSIASNYSSWFVFAVFFISETLMGLLPPEFFIAWSSKALNPWLFMFVLATLSYAGGIVAYYLGQLLFLIPAVRKNIERKILKHIVNLRKWGGFFVFVGAMLPVPHSVVSFTSGIIKFKFRHYLVWALFRYVRFFIFAVVIFKVL